MSRWIAWPSAATASAAVPGALRRRQRIGGNGRIARHERATVRGSEAAMQASRLCTAEISVASAGKARGRPRGWSRVTVDPRLKMQRHLVGRSAKGKVGGPDCQRNRPVGALGGWRANIEMACDQPLFARQVGGHQPRQMPAAGGGARVAMDDPEGDIVDHGTQREDSRPTGYRTARGYRPAARQAHPGVSVSGECRAVRVCTARTWRDRSDMCPIAAALGDQVGLFA